MHQFMLFFFCCIVLSVNNLVVCKYNINKILKEAHNNSLKFSWQNCGPSNDILQLTSLNVSPDPVPLPGVLTIDINANLLSNVKGPLSV